ncbi:uncharacterized protein isoform X3 [Rhodnius prolixus]|uniref:uncharacterized protein isoform X3 n=1 Tax=Rhodnius prolixus TaxID=13249 RepID=UPI003D188423
MKNLAQAKYIPLFSVGNETSKICLKTMCDKHRTLVLKRCRHLLDTPCNSMGKFDGHYPNEIYNKHDNAALEQGRISRVSDHVCNNQHIFRNHGHQPDCGNMNTKERVGKITGNTYQTKIKASTWNECRGNERRNSDIYQCFQGLRSEIRKLRYEVLRLGCRLRCGKIDCNCNRISRSQLTNFRNSQTQTNKNSCRH